MSPTRSPSVALDRMTPGLQGLPADLPTWSADGGWTSGSGGRSALALIPTGPDRCLRRRHLRSAWLAADVDPMEAARAKVDRRLRVHRAARAPFFTFHDRDIAPEGATFAETNRPTCERWSTHRAQDAERHRRRLLWGTANLFTNRGTAAARRPTPTPEVFAFAAAQVKTPARGHPSARRRQLRPVGRARGLRDAAQHRHQARARQLARFLTLVASTSTRSASRARS